MVITEPAEPRVGLLGLGSKRYPSNMQRMRNKEAFKGTQKSSKRKKGSAGRVKPDQRKKNGGKKKETENTRVLRHLVRCVAGVNFIVPLLKRTV